MKLVFAVLLICQPLLLAAQTSAPPAGSDWQRLQALQRDTRVHVASDARDRKCFFSAVDDESFSCTRDHDGRGEKYVFARAAVRSVKLVRHTRSALVGMAIGIGAGLAVGAIVGRVEDPPAPNAFLDFSGIARAAFTVGGGFIGAGAGAAIGGPTDFLRGPTVYLRP